MMKKLTLILIACGAGILGAQEDKQTKPSIVWRKALGSESFADRSAAMLDIWKAGEGGLAFLEELLIGDDPELAARALTIAQKIRTGITPETPEEVVELVETYFSANAGGKLRIIEQLKRQEQYEIILRLSSLETIDVVRESIKRTVKEIMPSLIRGRLNGGEFDEALRLLSLDPDFDSRIHYADLLQTLGRLDAEIERLKDSDSEVEQALYLTCLRVKGDAALLLSEATRLGDSEAAAVAALTLGDHLPYFRYLAEKKDQNLVDGLYLRWSIARANGEAATMKKMEESLRRLASGKNDERGDVRRNLHRMGYGTKIRALIEPQDYLALYEYELGQENYSAILPALGLREGESSDDWLIRLEKQAKEEFKGEQSQEATQILLFATSFYEARGMDAEAEKYLFKVFDLVRSRQNQTTSRWLGAAYGRPILAPKAAMKALAREIIEFDYTLSAGMEGLYSDSDSQEWLALRLRDLYPKMALPELLQLSASFSRNHPMVDVELFEEAKQKVYELARNGENQERDLNRLLLFARYRDWENDITTLQAELEKIGSPVLSRNLALTATSRGRYLEAGDHFKQVEVADEISTTIDFYEKALAFKKAELPEAAALFKKARLFSNGKAGVLEYFAGNHQLYIDDSASFELLQKALLRTRIESSSSSFSAGDTIVRDLAVHARTLGKWKEARAYGEVHAWTSNGSWTLGSVRSRFHILVAEGALAAEKGDLVAAVKAFTHSHALTPTDGYLANDLFPLLRELGLSELHDQLFADTARRCRKMIELYPLDDNALNNFAWSASRANRCLDEAEAYLKKALTMSPRSGSYLDTMAEIYFARRDRSEAVRWSNLSLNYEMTALELIRQNRRFIMGAFPAP